jgi:hypothetical protein
MSDFLGYSFSSDTIYANSAALQAVNTSNLFDGTLAYVTNSGLYKFSLQAKTGNIQPTTGPGWWLLLPYPYLLLNTSNQIDNSQINLAGSSQSLGQLTMTGRFLAAQGPDVASATNIVLGAGNYFNITGTTTIQTISASGWQTGSEITLHFSSAGCVLKNAGSGTGAPCVLSGNADLTSTQDQHIKLILNNFWFQTASSSP